MNTLEWLQARREELLEKKWVNHGPTYPDEVCLLYGGWTGLSFCCLGDDFSVATVFGPHIGTRDVVSWNDRPNRQFSEVIDLFDRAILAEKEKLV